MSTIYVDNILPYSGNSVFISGSVSSLTASFAETASFAPNYTLSSSFLNYTSSTNTRIGNLEAFSASLDATFATDAQLNTATSSLSSSINTLSSSFLSYTASTDAKIASINTITASLNASVASLNTQTASLLSYTSSNNTTNTTQNTRLSALEAATASLYTTTASFSGRVGALEAATASIYTTTASLNAAVSSLNSATSSLYSYTSSLNARSSSFATTGSNNFDGNQTITGSLNVSSNITTPGTITATTLVVQTITSSVDFVTGSTRFGTLTSNTHQFTGSVSISGSLAVNGVDYANLSSSFDTRVLNNSSSIGLLSSSYLASSASFDTRILNNSSSISLVDGNLQTASSSLSNRIASQEAFSSSLDSTFATDAQLNNATSSLSGSISNLSSSFLSYTASQNAINNTFATTGSNTFIGNQTITGSINISGSIFLVNGSDLVTHHIKAAGSNGLELFANNGALIASMGAGGGTQANFTGSLSSTTFTSPSITGSLFGTASNAISSSFAISASYAESASYAISSSFATSASYATTASYAENASNAISSSAAISASYAVSASYAMSSSVAISASYAESASYAMSSSVAVSASYSTTASYADSASIAISSSQAVTASHLTPVTNLYVNEIYPTTGNSANRIFTENQNLGFGGIGDTVIYTSLYDINLYAGAGTRAVKVTGSLGVSNGITGSLSGTASFATSATSASYADNANLLNGLDSSTFTSTASFQNYTSSTNASISSINTATSSLSGSISDLSSSFLAATASISSSVGALSSSFLSYTSSNNAQVSLLNNFTSSQLVLNGTYALTSSLNSFTSSQLVLNGKYATTASNTFTGNQIIQGTLYNSNTTNATGFTSTAATYTDGGLRVAKDAYISGSTYIAGNLTVFGTSSITYVTASEFIGLEFINLNSDLPSLRYAGLNIGDSGSSAGISSSLWYDSQKDNWLVTYTNVGAPTSSLLINGPMTYNSVGNEVGITPNFLTKGQAGLAAGNDHHITSSQISDDGITVRIPNNLQVTGSLFAGNLTGSLNGSNLVDASVANAKLTNSSVTINGTSLSLGGTLTQAQTLAGAFSGSAQVNHDATTNYVANQHIDHTTVSVSAGNGLSGGGTIAATRTISLDTTSATFTNGVKSKLNADGVVSSSAQIDHNATTNYVANRHIDHSAVSISAGSGLTGGGDITTTRTLSIATGGVTNSMLQNSTISGISLGSNLSTLTIGTGLSGTSYNGSGAVTIANTGVTSVVAGTGISINQGTGAVTVTNTITNNNQLTNGSGFQTTSGTVAKVENTVSGTNSADLVYGNMADNDQFRIRIGGTATNSGFVEIATADDGTEPIYVRQYTGVFGSLVRTATLLDGSGNTTFPGDVTAYSSDERLKENVQNIPNALDKVLSLNGVTFDWKQEAFDAGFNPKIKEGDAGVLAQQVQAVLPQAVRYAPFDRNHEGESISGKDYLTVQYEKLAPLFIEAIKEQQVLIQSQQSQIDELKELVNQLLNK